MAVVCTGSGCSSPTGSPTDGPATALDSGSPLDSGELPQEHEPAAVALLDDDRLQVTPAPPWGEELVAGGSFESGELTLWSTVAGAEGCLIADPTASPGLEAVVGESWLRGDGHDDTDCHLVQLVDLEARGFPGARVDAGQVAVQGQAWLGSLSEDGAYDDQIWLRVRFLDAEGAELSEVRTRSGASPSWDARGLSGLLPQGTRQLAVEVEGRWRQSGGNDTRADAVSVWLDRVDEAVLPVITKQPVLQDSRTDTMRLLWETDTNLAEHFVYYGPTGEPLDRRVRPVESRQLHETHFVHVAELTGLEAGSSWDYQVQSGTTLSAVYTFRTAPSPEDTAPVRLVWTGDNHQGFETFAELVALARARDPDLFVSAGDIANYGPDITHIEGELHQWQQQWFAPLETASLSQEVPVFFARGNHEKHYELSYAFSALPWDTGWYAFTYGPLAVLVLDSQTAGLDGQLSFIEETLASRDFQAAAWRIATFHVAPYSNATKTGSNGRGHETIQADWVPRLEAGGVDLVVSAHYHSYQQGEQAGVRYAVVGGGGATFDTKLEEAWDFISVYRHTHHYAVLDADPEALTWTAYDLDDVAFDSFTLTR